MTGGKAICKTESGKLSGEDLVKCVYPNIHLHEEFCKLKLEQHDKYNQQGAGKKCVFPFKYYGIEYTACAEENGIVWCSTETGKSEF